MLSKQTLSHHDARLSQARARAQREGLHPDDADAIVRAYTDPTADLADMRAEEED